MLQTSERGREKMGGADIFLAHHSPQPPPRPLSPLFFSFWKGADKVFFVSGDSSYTDLGWAGRWVFGGGVESAGDRATNLRTSHDLKKQNTK